MPGEGTNLSVVFDVLAEGTCLRIDELAAATGLTRRIISKAATALIGRDLVERVEVGCFRLTAAGYAAKAQGVAFTSGPNGPHTGKRRPVAVSLRARLWRAMRVKRKFSIPDLLEMAATGGERRAENNAQRYVRALTMAGYLVPLPVRARGIAPTSPGFHRYRLARDSGPAHPVLLGADAVRDPNTGEVHPCNRA